MNAKAFLFKKIVPIIFCSFFILGCTEKDTKKEYTTAKKDTNYSHFYPAKIDTKDLTKHHTVYLPVYSHVYTSEEGHEPMGITLSIRNTDETQNLVIQKISYYNTYGDFIDSYIEEPHILKPMASIDFVVALRDMRGGSGANFIVEWAELQTTSTPIIQAVMVNNSGNRAFSFITNGYIIK